MTKKKTTKTVQHKLGKCKGCKQLRLLVGPRGENLCDDCKFPKYTTRGRERGECGHEHDTLAQAHECALADYIAAESNDTRSDRNVERADRSEMTAHECDELAKLEAAYASEVAAAEAAAEAQARCAKYFDARIGRCTRETCPYCK